MMTLAPIPSERCRTVATLSRLARVCRDGEARLHHTADRCSLDALRGMLLRYARERARFAHELEIETQVLGGSVPFEGSGKRPRVSPVEPVNDAQRVATCRLAEESALDEYARAVAGPLPVEIVRLLRGHHAAVKETIARLTQAQHAVA
jgi:hypothetical protein